MNGMPNFIGDSKLQVATFVDGLPEVFEQAAAWIRKDAAINVGLPDVDHVAVNQNEDGDFILALYFKY
jgi:hypothetical protein